MIIIKFWFLKTKNIKSPVGLINELNKVYNDPKKLVERVIGALKIDGSGKEILLNNSGLFTQFGITLVDSSKQSLQQTAPQSGIEAIANIDTLDLFGKKEYTSSADAETAIRNDANSTLARGIQKDYKVNVSGETKVFRVQMTDSKLPQVSSFKDITKDLLDKKTQLLKK